MPKWLSLKTMTENYYEYLCITSKKYGNKSIHEKLLAYSSRLYCIDIKPVEINMMSNQKLDNKEMMNLWHDRLGHPGMENNAKNY